MSHCRPHSGSPVGLPVASCASELDRLERLVLVERRAEAGGRRDRLDARARRPRSRRRGWSSGRRARRSGCSRPRRCRRRRRPSRPPWPSSCPPARGRDRWCPARPRSPERYAPPTASGWCGDHKAAARTFRLMDSHSDTSVVERRWPLWVAAQRTVTAQSFTFRRRRASRLPTRWGPRRGSCGRRAARRPDGSEAGRPAACA